VASWRVAERTGSTPFDVTDVTFAIVNNCVALAVIAPWPTTMDRLSRVKNNQE
jgi:hypothetical protein